MNDELDYLGMYLSYRDFVSVLKETVQSEDLSDVTQLFFDGARDELDGYYDSKQTEYPIQKPRPEWIEESMDDLIHKIYHSNHFKKNELCTLFLEAAYQTSQRQAGYLLQLYNMVKRQKMIVEDEMFVSSLIVDSTEINLVFPLRKLNKELMEKAKFRSLAKLKLNQLSESYAIFCELNRKNKLASVKIDYVRYEDIQKYNQQKLEEIGKKIFNLRKQRLMDKQGIKWYPDTEMCP